MRLAIWSACPAVALAEVVQASDDGRAPGVGIRGDLQVRRVGAEGRAPVLGHRPSGSSARAFPAYARPRAPPAASPRCTPGPSARCSGQDAARHGSQVGVNDERATAAGAGQGATAVGIKGLLYFRGCAGSFRRLPGRPT